MSVFGFAAGKFTIGKGEQRVVADAVSDLKALFGLSIEQRLEIQTRRETDQTAVESGAGFSTFHFLTFLTLFKVAALLLRALLVCYMEPLVSLRTQVSERARKGVKSIRLWALLAVKLPTVFIISLINRLVLMTGIATTHFSLIALFVCFS